MTMTFIAGLVLKLPGIWYLDALTGVARTKPSDSSVLLQILLFNEIMFPLVEVRSSPICQPAARRRAREQLLRLGSTPLARDRDRSRHRRRSMAAGPRDRPLAAL